MRLAKEYEDLTKLHINTEEPRCWYIPKAVEGDEERTIVLSSDDWSFGYFADPESVPDDFYERDFESSDFNKIKVPSCWQSLGYDHKHYSGGDYCIPYDPPYVPDENPCGAYCKDFYLTEDNCRLEQYLYFEGVEAGFYLWVNGHYAGYSQVSHSPSEFCISDYVQAGRNRIAVLVLKWTDGTYLEAQDKYRYNGIFRDVSLLLRPKNCVFDYTVRTELSEDLSEAKVCVRLDACKGNPEARLRLVAPDGRIVGEKDAEKPGAFARIIVSDPQLWTAEAPVLYMLEIVTEDEVICQETGIRCMEVKEGVMYLNRKQVRLLGVNRHDSDPVTGYTVSREHVLRDLKMMKEANINAIRTSHYPNAPWFVQLCCEYGFYLIAEADYETHGTMGLVGEEPISTRFGRISRDPVFHDAILDRMKLNVIRDKNQCCVLIWSLGNESGYGKNLSDAAAWAKEYDPTRLIHYEGAHWAPPGLENDQSSLDMVSRMYPRIDEIKQYLADPSSVKPYILCEFVHAMGNGPGDIEDYLEVILPEPRIIGAFVWEWCDHATYEGKAADGRDRYFYGGDYNEFPNDGNFCMDGLVYPDRRPHTGLAEWKNGIRPARARLMEVNPVKIALWNRLDYTDLKDAITIEYEISREGTVLAEGTLAAPSAAPHGEGMLILPEECRPEDGAYLLLRYRSKETSGLLQAGQLLGFDQIPLSEEHDRALRSDSSDEKWNVSETQRTFVLEKAGRQIVFDRRLGTISSIKIDDMEQLMGPVRYLTFRAPTNNDKFISEKWRFAGYDRSSVKVYSSRITADGSKAAVEFDFSIGSAARQNFIRAKAVWNVDSEGAVILDFDGTFDRNFVYMPRFGLGFRLPDDNEKVCYYGYGPHESYVDKHRGSFKGLFTSTVSEELEDYVFPQENGSHYGCEYAQAGRLFAEGEKPFSFQALPYSVEELDKKMHNFELERDGSIYVALDYAQSGIGSNSCGPALAEKYQLKDEKIKWKIRFGFKRNGQ